MIIYFFYSFSSVCGLFQVSRQQSKKKYVPYNFSPAHASNFPASGKEANCKTKMSSPLVTNSLRPNSINAICNIGNTLHTVYIKQPPRVYFLMPLYQLL